VVGHSFGAMLGARFAVDHEVSAYAGLSGVWQDWFGDAPFPLPLLDIPNLLTWGGAGDFLTQLSDGQWNQMHRPRHRVVFAQGEHWDYLAPVSVPCGPGPGPCGHIGAATDDLVTMFLAKYLPPELATDLPPRVPGLLVPPPELTLTFEQEFYAGGFLNGWDALVGPDCAATVDAVTERLVANTRSKETHSLDHPCAWVSKISSRHRWLVGERPTGYHWCDFCFPARADG
jgi:hypothetical protein